MMATSSSVAKSGASISPPFSHLKQFPLLGSSTSISPRFHFSQLPFTLNRTLNAPLLPIIRAQTSPGTYIHNHTSFHSLILSIFFYEFRGSISSIKPRYLTCIANLLFHCFFRLHPRCPILQSWSYSQVQGFHILASFFFFFFF